MTRHQDSGRGLRPRRRTEGITLIELLIAMGIFGVLIAALSGLFITAARGYEAAAQTSEEFQDAEAALQIMLYDIRLAGYRGVGSDFDKSFSGADQDTVSVLLGTDTDEIRVRYFEDDTYLKATDDGERTIAYYVDTDSSTLIRTEAGTDYEVVSNITGFRVDAFVQPDQIAIDVRNADGTPAPPPTNISAVEMTLSFEGGRSWTFAASLSSPQQASVASR